MEVANSTGNDITWKYLFTDLADPRTSEWFLMSNPVPLALILFSYLYFVKKCGPEYMKNRNPYSLKRIIMFYNMIQVAWNIWLFNEAVTMWSNFNWNCENVNWSYSAVAMRQRIACYSYFINKVSDLLDTVFFVLRKKDRQISFLHVFHHSIMPITTWLMVKYFPGGHVTFIGLLNTFVHILLYGYYFLAAFGPQVQKYLWWKKYITKLQLLQFCLVFIHNSQLLFFDCGFPRWTLVLTLPNAIFFYYLFNEFYKDSYEKPKETKNRASKDTVKAK